MAQAAHADYHSGHLAEPKKEEVQMVTVTKRKIRKVSLRITPLTERLVILPMTKEQQEKSIAL